MVGLRYVRAVGVGTISLSVLLLTGCGSTTSVKSDSVTPNPQKAPAKAPPQLQVKKVANHRINQVKLQKAQAKPNKAVQIKRAAVKKVKKITKADRAAWIAQKQLNIPYVWGGTTPKGFDCSGLVQYSYKVNQLKLPRTASQQYASTKRIPTHQAKTGDLVFFKNTGKRKGITHVGIYLGNGRFIHAPRKGKTVEITKVEDKYWGKHLVGYGRVDKATNG